MLTIGFPAVVAGTNCYVLAPAGGEECLIVDPGVGVTGQLAEVLREHRLRPAAVLLTHGHFDHVYSVTPVCDSAAVAAYIHGQDRYRLADPLSAVGPELIAMFEQQFGQKASWQEPTDVVTLVDGQSLTIAGLDLRVLHAPGHTQGSVIFSLPDVPEGMAADAGVRSTVLSGDVLFAGSIGRTDLAGGDGAAMNRSLRDVVLPLADDVLVLPGHGPATTMERERATNPYLQGLAS
ncbi:MAG: MBL fold metallo-hydrolase [Actinobacteria bacterium]|nr:MBL fold metallo-hydrolase [Actinomycetota bacterium]